MLGNMMLVAVGSALGGMTRYAVNLSLPYDSAVDSIPLATLLVNLTGSIVIGLISGLALPGGLLAGAPYLNLFLGVGLLGGFTTFSAFSQQTAQMLIDGEPFLVFAYATVSVWGCVIAGLAGLYVGARI